MKPIQESLRHIHKDRWLLIMMLPGILYFIIFKYIPMGGIVIAFQNYQPFLGFTGSKWVGFEHFQRFFSEPAFWLLLRNTVVLGLLILVVTFPIKIVLALMLNEIRLEVFKRVVQTLTYIPHFMSWVVIVGIVHIFFTTEGGVVNELIHSWGGTKINFLLSEEWFRTFIVGERIWKETGWGTIIFLAALAGVDPQLYEAARMDGASRLRQIWHVTLPAIRSTIVILLILQLGDFLDLGFDQVYMHLNAMNRNVGEIFDTYVYSKGIAGGQFSYSTAIGLFKSVVGLILVMGSNYLAKKFGEEGIY
ncbi:ABC transporter permease [Paenibacillus puerhi]|uniref:ABC transporter permease n=1 Tax=Paenibacillus puerhi TaxID=2692622 RepID=UPI00135B7E08|nr:sugar ABC transporter permease [Paenibacillus puerhi]